jgi:hypothetical protein
LDIEEKDIFTRVVALGGKAGKSKSKVKGQRAKVQSRTGAAPAAGPDGLRAHGKFREGVSYR